MTGIGDEVCHRSDYYFDMSKISNGVIQNAIPVIAVADMKASVQFYTEQLGFKLDWGGEGDAPHIGSVSRDGHAIMLQQRRPLTHSVVWIGVSSLASLWTKVKTNPTIVVEQRPTNQPWALEMRINDPDGNTLWFGTESLTNVPFGQEPPDEAWSQQIWVRGEF